MELLLSNTQDIDDFKLRCKLKLLERIELVLGTKLFDKTYSTDNETFRIVFDVDLSYRLSKKESYYLIPKFTTVSVSIFVNGEEVYCDVHEYSISLFLKYTIGELINNDILTFEQMSEVKNNLFFTINNDINLWYDGLKINNEYHNLKEFL